MQPIEDRGQAHLGDLSKVSSLLRATMTHTQSSENTEGWGGNRSRERAGTQKGRVEDEFTDFFFRHENALT